MGTGDWNDGLDEIGSGGPGRRLARLLPPLHPVQDGRRRRPQGRPESSRPLRRPAPRPGGRDRVDLAGGVRCLRVHDDGTEISVKKTRRLGDRRPDGGVGRDARASTRRGSGDRLRDGTEPWRRRRRSSSAGPRSAGTRISGRAAIYQGSARTACIATAFSGSSARRLLAWRLVERRAKPDNARRAIWRPIASGSRPRRFRTPSPARSNLRRPAEQRSSRHGQNVRPRPDDLERIHSAAGWMFRRAIEKSWGSARCMVRSIARRPRRRAS